MATSSSTPTSEPISSNTEYQILTCDPSHPIYLHPSDHPGLVLVTQPLIGDKFNQWHCSMTLASSAKNKLGIVTVLERRMETIDADAGDMLEVQAAIWHYMFQFADSMALKCAVELRIPDIIHSHGNPITLSQMASAIGSKPPDITSLARILKLLVHKKIFTSIPQSDGGETLYALTHSSRWLLHDAELSLAPMLLLETNPWLVDPWHHLGGCVREGGNAFKRAHGHEIFDFASINPEFSKTFNDAMECTAKIFMNAIVSGYKDGLSCIGSLVDVGGGTGTVIAEIVKAYPHIKGINFDLPHVIKTAPEYQGVSHLGGDMFKAVPNADTVFMKWIMHDWSDEDCVKILNNVERQYQKNLEK